MKRLILVIVLFCFLSSTAESQQPQSKAANADVLATVQNDVTVTTTGQTNFGTFGNSAHTETINPAAPAGDQSTAMFALSNPSGGQVVLECPSTTTFTAPTS
jgi:spore coat protein U-like protein